MLPVSYEELDDREVMASIVRQDRGALEALCSRYSGAVYSLAMHMLRDSGAAEEVTQDVFFSVWRRASSYQADRGSVTAWLFSIAHHRTIDELRRRRRDHERLQFDVDLSNKPSGDGGGDPVEYTSTRFKRGQLDEALESLKPEQREIVVLAYFGGLTHSEIAARLEQPLGTVKTRMRSGLRKLREVLGPKIPDRADYGL